MKQSIIFVLLTIVCIAVKAQVPGRMNYQAIVRDIDGMALAEQLVTVNVVITSGKDGATRYQEARTLYSDASGLISFAIGEEGLGWSSLDWVAGDLYMKVSLEVPELGIQLEGDSAPLGTVPYAFFADQAGSVLVEKQQLLLSNDTMFLTHGGGYQVLPFSKGSKVGDMQYWSGQKWLMVPKGKPGQLLGLNAAGLPAWTGNYYPIVQLDSISSNPNSPVVFGRIIENGGRSISELGLQFSKDKSQILEGQTEAIDYTADNFQKALLGLDPFTQYFVRIFAKNEVGTGYSHLDSLNTGDNPLKNALSINVLSDTIFLDRWADTTVLKVTVTAEKGVPINDYSLKWQSLDESVALVAEDGMVKSVGLGQTVIRIIATQGTLYYGERDITVAVVEQPEFRCPIPEMTARGQANGIISYTNVRANDLPLTQYDGAEAFGYDFDGDGDIDIVRLEFSYPFSQVYSGQVKVFRNEGNFNFVDVTDDLIDEPMFPDHARDSEIADFDGDGVDELYIACHGYDAPPFPGSPNLLLNYRDGKILNEFESAFDPARIDGFTHGSATADCDCDGDADILELNLEPYLFSNDGSGNFSRSPFPLNAEYWMESTFIDFDADGDADLVIGSASDTPQPSKLLVNNGQGVFEEREGVNLPEGGYGDVTGVNTIKAADFDGDGLEDLVAFEIPRPFSPVSKIRLFLNNGDGSFRDVSLQWNLPAECSGELVSPLKVLDVNNDKWPDLVIPDGCPELGGAGLLINAGDSFNSYPFTLMEPYFGIDTATPLFKDGQSNGKFIFGTRGGDLVTFDVKW